MIYLLYLEEVLKFIDSEISFRCIISSASWLVGGMSRGRGHINWFILKEADCLVTYYVYNNYNVILKIKILLRFKKRHKNHLLKYSREALVTSCSKKKTWRKFYRIERGPKII